ncbi:MAG: hypothetical protein ABL973_01785 [Micropepsaceae bacterium]
MNIERFNAIARAILADLGSFNSNVKVAELLQHLRQRIAEPGSASVVKTFDQALIEMRERLPKLESNMFSPTWAQHMREHSLDLFIGADLLDRVEGALGQMSLTPSVAEKELGIISQHLSDQVTALQNFVAAMDRFKVSSELLAPGTAELGVLIPRIAVSNDVNTFGKELIRISQLVGVFQEIATGSRAELKIDSVSSSDLSIFFTVDPVTAKLWLDALNGILDTFKNIIDIRTTIQDLRSKGVPDQAIEGLEKHANEQMEAKISKTVDETLNAQGIVTRRRTELVMELKMALNGIAVKLDNGFNFEVRSEPFEAVSADDEDQAARQAALKAVKAGAGKLRFVRITGQPILKLAAPAANDEVDAATEKAEGKPDATVRKPRRKTEGKSAK